MSLGVLFNIRAEFMGDNPIVEWWVRVEGEQQDLVAAQRLFRKNEICRIDQEDDENFYLKSVQFNSLSDGREVLAHTGEIVLRINGAVKVEYPDSQPIRASGTLKTLHANGSLGVVICPETLVFKLRCGHVEAFVGAHEAAEEVPSFAERCLELSATSENVADVLLYLSREPNWFDLYKLFEVIRSAHNNQSAMISTLSTDESDRAVLHDKARLFTWTANAVHDIRHARPRDLPPEKPMNLVDAGRFMLDLARRYLASLLD